MKCPICGEELHWESDASYEDLGLEENGIVSFTHCVSCGCDIEIYQPEINPYKEDVSECKEAGEQDD